MAEIFNNFDRQTETQFLTALEEDNRESAERIKTLMFTFDDLVKLDPGSAQTLMRHIEKDKLAVALEGAAEPVRQFFMSNMSTRAAKMLVDDMGAMGPVRLRDVDERAGPARQPRQGPRRQGRNRHFQDTRRRRADLLMGAPAKFLFDVDFAAGANARRPSRSPSTPTTARRGRIRRTTPRLRASAKRRRGRDQPPDRRHARAHRGQPRRSDQGTRSDRSAARMRSRRGRGSRRPQAGAGFDRPRAVRRNIRARQRVASASWSPRRILSCASTIRLCRGARKASSDVARAHGFEGPPRRPRRTPASASADCRIEWADGGVNREASAAEGAIGEAVTRYISARRSLAAAT